MASPGPAQSHQILRNSNSNPVAMNAIKLSRLKQACLILIYGMFSKFMPQVPTSRLNGRKMTVTTVSSFMIGFMPWLVTGIRGVPDTGYAGVVTLWASLGILMKSAGSRVDNVHRNSCV